MMKNLFSILALILGAVLHHGAVLAKFPTEIESSSGTKFCGGGGMYLFKTYEYKAVDSYADCADACEAAGSSVCGSFNLYVDHEQQISCELNSPVTEEATLCDVYSAWYSTSNCGDNKRPILCCNSDFGKYGNEDCKDFGIEECEINIVWMNNNCRYTCENSFACNLQYDDTTEADQNKDCINWATWGECEANPDWMATHCASTCAKRKAAQICDISDRPDDKFKLSDQVTISDTYKKPVSDENPIKWPYTVSYSCKEYAGEGNEYKTPRGLTACQVDGSFATSPYLIGDAPRCAEPSTDKE